MKQKIRLTESDLLRIVNETVKKALKEDVNSQEQRVNDAIDALVGIRETVSRAGWCLEYLRENPQIGKLIRNISRDIAALYGFSRYGEEYRLNAERWQHESD